MRKTLYIVCYDICGDDAPRRLRQVYKTMRGYGEHVQYSVFRCVLTELQLAELEDRLTRWINHRTDQILIVPLGNADRPETWEMYTVGVPIDAPERVVRIV
ncbi:MAG: CRISPR-associated endonuclease Cas2 [Myxococcota bacterium]